MLAEELTSATVVAVALSMMPVPPHEWEAATWIFTAIGDTQFLAAEYEKARVALTHVMLFPKALDNPFVWLRRGQVYFELGDTRLAEDSLASAYLLGGKDVFSGEDPKYAAFNSSETQAVSDGRLSCLQIMGLDSVEIVMGWEESFGISISNDEAITLRTPNLAIDLIVQKLGAPDEPQRPCLTLRAFHRLRHSLMNAASVTRDRIRPVALLKTLISTDRRRTWQAVRVECGMASLPSPGWLFEPRTVGDLAHWAVVHATKGLKGGESWTRSEIRSVVRAVVSDVTGAKEFDNDDDFIHDIGLD